MAGNRPTGSESRPRPGGVKPKGIPRGFETLATDQPSEDQLQEFHRCYGHPQKYISYRYQLDKLLYLCQADGDVIADVRLSFLSYTHSGFDPFHFIPECLGKAFRHQLIMRRVNLDLGPMPGPEGIPWPTFRVHVLELNAALTAAMQVVDLDGIERSRVRASYQPPPRRQQQQHTQAQRTRQTQMQQTRTGTPPAQTQQVQRQQPQSQHKQSQPTQPAQKTPQTQTQPTQTTQRGQTQSPQVNSVRVEPPRAQSPQTQAQKPQAKQQQSQWQNSRPALPREASRSRSPMEVPGATAGRDAVDGQERGRALRGTAVASRVAADPVGPIVTERPGTTSTTTGIESIELRPVMTSPVMTSPTTQFEWAANDAEEQQRRRQRQRQE